VLVDKSCPIDRVFVTHMVSSFFLVRQHCRFVFSTDFLFPQITAGFLPKAYGLSSVHYGFHPSLIPSCFPPIRSELLRLFLLSLLNPVMPVVAFGSFYYCHSPTICYYPPGLGCASSCFRTQMVFQTLIFIAFIPPPLGCLCEFALLTHKEHLATLFSFFNREPSGRSSEFFLQCSAG